MRQIDASPIDPDYPTRNSPERRAGLSRRNFLKRGTTTAVALGAVAALAGKVRAQEMARRLDRIRSIPSQPNDTPLDPALLQLINRTTFGFDRATYDEAALVGHDAYVEQQLDYETIDDSALDARLASLETLSMSAEEIFVNYENDNTPIFELIQGAILSAVYSKRQLHERMVEFWTDHFNINILDDFDRYLKTVDDREVIRQHAMTTFPQLLNASARSPAMLWYLDNYANIVGRAQENFSRELMELHTLGVDGGYTQQDVEEVARCLTGWTFSGRSKTSDLGIFVFHEPFHDFGSKTVLGQFIPAGGGISDGQTVLDMLAYHPSTARFIARKLCKKFLSYDPPEDIVETVKATYLATGGDIKAMLRVILRADVMQYMATPKYKRPFHLMASALRSIEADVNDPATSLWAYVFLMGHGTYLWPQPDGYPDTLDVWATAQLPRWQFGSYVAEGNIPMNVDFDALVQSEGGDVPGGQAAAIDRIVTGGILPSEHVAMLQAFYDDQSELSPRALSNTFGLALSLPASQWY